jgi:hypothetical protein
MSSTCPFLLYSSLGLIKIIDNQNAAIGDVAGELNADVDGQIRGDRRRHLLGDCPIFGF